MTEHRERERRMYSGGGTCTVTSVWLPALRLPGFFGPREDRKDGKWTLRKGNWRKTERAKLEPEWGSQPRTAARDDNLSDQLQLLLYSASMHLNFMLRRDKRNRYTLRTSPPTLSLSSAIVLPYRSSLLLHDPQSNRNFHRVLSNPPVTRKIRWPLSTKKVLE